jgi:mannose-6-phosphate isomerase-like protein (cupin superfamily)
MAEIVIRRWEPEDARPLQGSVGSIHVLIDPSTGSARLCQRVLALPPGASGHVGHPGADDVLYVAIGSGLLASAIRDEQHALRAGMAALVPAKVPANVINTSREELVMVSVLSPPPFDGLFTMDARDLPLTSVHEEDREPLPAGEDRSFKLLIQSEHMTQFVGFIDTSKAPPHTHTYEEAIYVLEGEGLVHADGSTTPILAGSSIFLPPGTPHCLENAGAGVLKILGIFSPPGSPADKRDKPNGDA